MIGRVLRVKHTSESTAATAAPSLISSGPMYRSRYHGKLQWYTDLHIVSLCRGMTFVSPQQFTCMVSRAREALREARLRNKMLDVEQTL